VDDDGLPGRLPPSKACLARAVGVARELIVGEEAASMMEYGLLVALIALVVAGALVSLGGQLSSMFGKVSTCVSTASC
jgi:pilus assembly protein Flp/PilA